MLREWGKGRKTWIGRRLRCRLIRLEENASCGISGAAREKRQGQIHHRGTQIKAREREKEAIVVCARELWSSKERSFTRARGFRMTATTKSKAKQMKDQIQIQLQNRIQLQKQNQKSPPEKSGRPLQIQEAVQLQRAGGTALVRCAYAFSSQVSPARRSLARSPLPFLAITSRICCWIRSS